MNLQPFNEDRESDQASALDARSQDFPWKEVYAAFGEDELQELGLDDAERLSVAFNKFLHCVADGYNQSGVVKPIENIGRRAVAFLWIINPGLIAGSPSLSKIARDINCHKVAMSQHVVSIRRKFGLKNRATAHGWNFKANPQPAHGDEPAEEGEDSDE